MARNSRNYKYEKLPQSDNEEAKDTAKKWWNPDRRWSERNKSEERIDNKKNELAEKQMELKELKEKKKEGEEKNSKSNGTKKNDKKNV